MASFRKRPHPRISEEAAPVTTAATAAAKLPEPTTEQAAPEPNPADAKPSAVKQAEKGAIQKRLAELDGAERLQQEVHDQQVRFAKERQQQVAQIPDHIRRWAEANPRYVSDPIGQAELNVALMKATRDGKGWNDHDFVETVERHLGPTAAPRSFFPLPTPLTAYPVRTCDGLAAYQSVFRRRGSPLGHSSWRQLEGRG
jgi:hypothetical protein